MLHLHHISKLLTLNPCQTDIVKRITFCLESNVYLRPFIAFDRLLVSIKTADPEGTGMVLVTEGDNFGTNTALLFDSQWCERRAQESYLCGQEAGGAAEEDVVEGHGGGIGLYM